MAFNSVGSSYPVHMEFSRRILSSMRGGCIRIYDGMGKINATPFSQSAQTTA